MVSVVIPAYKERECLEKLLPEIFKYISSEGNEVIIVNDESGDNTCDTLVRLALKHNFPLKQLNRRKKLGLASAIYDGISFARYNEIIIMDADGQHPPRYLPQMIEALKTHDLVVGTRYFIKGASVPGFNTTRIFGSLVCNLLAWPLTGLKDSTSGFFGFKKSSISEIPPILDPKAFKVGLEYFSRVDDKKEVPISFEHRYSGKTKMSLVQLRYYLKQLAEAYARKFDLRKFLQFCMVGTTGVFINLGILTTSVELANIQYNLAAALSFMGAVVWNFSLNKFWTFRNVQVSWLEGIWKFLLVALCGLAIKQFTLTTFVEVWSVDYRVAALIGIAIASVVNFYGNKTWTFKKPQKGVVSFVSKYIQP